MVLTRRLSRDLRGGAQVIVTRQWQIDFTRKPGKIEITGMQISARVEAPEKVRAIARIEEARDTNAMFPICLSAKGLIENSGHIDNSAAIAAATSKAEELISQRPDAEESRAGLRQLVAKLQNAGHDMLETMPADLFFPTAMGFQDERQLPLPDGSVGIFKLAYQSARSTDGPWLDWAERKIETQIHNDIRHSSEKWHLKPAE